MEKTSRIETKPAKGPRMIQVAGSAKVALGEEVRLTIRIAHTSTISINGREITIQG